MKKTKHVVLFFNYERPSASETGIEGILSLGAVSIVMTCNKPCPSLSF